MTTRHYCTLLDGRYALRARALLRSLRRHARPFRMTALCLDREAERALAGEEDLEVVPLAALEVRQPGLRAAREDRSWLEYCYTCTPALIADRLAADDDSERITYLDADLYFYSSPEPLHAAVPAGGIGIVGHRFPERLRHLEAYGRFNVGWVSFGRGPVAAECLERWREQCLAWCFDRLEPGRYGDQKYLDEWPERYPGVVVLEHPGAGLAPWNAERHALAADESGEVTVDRAPLVFHHFHGLHREPGRARTGLRAYGARISPALWRLVYRPYLRELRALDRDPARARPRARTTVSVAPLRELPAATLEQWSAWHAAAPPGLDSPFLSPAFALAADRAGHEVEVALVEREGCPVGLLPYERRGREGWSIAHPMNDAQGVLGDAAGLTPSALLHGVGLDRIHFDHAPAGQEPFRSRRERVAESPRLVLTAGFEAWARGRPAAAPDPLARLRTLGNRLAREHGPLRFEARAEPALLDRLLEWKSAQYRRSGLADLFAQRRHRRLLAELLAEPGLGCLSSLHAGPHVVALHFGLVSARVWHWWFPAYDPVFARHSSGLLLLVEMARTAAALGFAAIDLGKGPEPYKRRFASEAVELCEGLLDDPAERAEAAGRRDAGLETALAAARARVAALRGSLSWRLTAPARLRP